MPRRSRPTLALLLAGALTAVTTVGCGSASGDGDGLHIEAAFYPLAYVAEAVGGDLVTVHELTPAGAEPHDLDLKPRDVGRMSDADLVVYLAGMQPAVDDAVRDAGATAFEVSATAGLDLQLADGLDHDHGVGEAHSDDEAHGDEEHGEDAHAHEDGESHGADEEGHDEDGHEHEEGADAPDPHFWLDPTKMASVATAVGEQLADIDPPNAATYRANASALVAELTDLDDEMAAALSECQEPDLVTSHVAFGYLARRYGFHQVGIAGLSPNREPSAAKLADVADFIEANGVSTVYFETLASPALAKALAAETGANAAVLDPLEGISDDSPGTDYPSVMRANLAALRAGQGCR